MDDYDLHDFDDDCEYYEDNEGETDDMGQTDRSVYLQMMHSVSKHSQGISFVLLMQHPVAPHNTYDRHKYFDYSIHPRFNQPCQGGETRKYESTHPGECTQPHNSKPHDLFHPFPDGIPSAISFPLRGMNNLSELDTKFLKSFIRADSPWFKGFGGIGNVDFLTDDKGLVYGYLIGHNNLDVDPTILINMINTVKSLRGHVKNWAILQEHGLTDLEATAVLMLNQCSIQSVAETGTYYFPELFSAQRFFGQQPNDLSGGTYSARTDYNRTYIQDVFLGTEDEGCKYWDATLMEKLKVSGYHPKVSTADLAKAAKEYFTEQLANEKIEVKPYQYIDAYGKVKPTPVINKVNDPIIKVAA